jgi:hypothetical protein
LKRGESGKNMSKIKDILCPREKDLINDYQSEILNTNIEDLDRVFYYQNLILSMVQKAKERYYEENPLIVPIKKEEYRKVIESKDTLKIRDLFTKEEVDEVDFLRWRMSKSIFPSTRRRNQKKIEAIITEVKRRNGN